MFDAITQVPAPYNEPVNDFAPGTPARVALQRRLKELAAEQADLGDVGRPQSRLAAPAVILSRQPRAACHPCASARMNAMTMPYGEFS